MTEREREQEEREPDLNCVREHESSNAYMDPENPFHATGTKSPVWVRICMIMIVNRLTDKPLSFFSFNLSCSAAEACSVKV